MKGARERKARRHVPLGPVLAGSALALAIALFMRGGLVQALLDRDVSFVLPPAVLALALALAAEVLGAVLGGTLVPRMRGALQILAAGVFLCLLLSAPPTPPALRPAALPVLLLSLVAACSGPVVHFTGGLPVLRALARSLFLALAGLVSWYLLSSIRPLLSSLQPFGPPLPVALLCGFASSAAASLLSALAFSKNPYLSVAGGWIGRRSSSAFFLGALLALYFARVRQPASTLLGPWLPVAEWGAVGLAASVGFWLLGNAVKRSSEPVSYGELAKHLQVVKMGEDADIAEVAGLVRDFIERGSKSGLLVHLVSAASAGGIPRERVARAVEGLADYRDAPMPSIALRWEVERLARANREARRRVLESTIKELERL